MHIWSRFVEEEGDESVMMWCRKVLNDMIRREKYGVGKEGYVATTLMTGVGEHR